MGSASFGDDGGGIAGRMWMKCRNESIVALYTPFVISLASGNLDTQSFVHFVSQDIYYLEAFAQAYELAEEYADDDEDKASIHKLRKRVLKKLNTHDVRVQELGFEIPSERSSDKATVKYIDFLTATTSGKVTGQKCHGKIATPFEKTKLAAYTLAAVAPCMRLFAFLSQEIQSLQDSDESTHIYKKWIDSLSSRKYEASASQIEELLDKLSISLTGEELEVVEKLYHQALKIQVDFFSTQHIAQETVVPFPRAPDAAEYNLDIFCDFDMTCTAVDSSAVLAELAIIIASKAHHDDSEALPARISSTDLRATCSSLSSQYIEEYEQCIENITSVEAVEGFNYEGLIKALEQLSDFERRANSRVVQSGVLKGLHLDDIKRAGECLSFQDGCRGFFQEIVKTENMKTDVHVLSYCWCGDLIRSAFSVGDVKLNDVHSNELVFEGDLSTGEINRKVESPMEKLQAFNTILNEQPPPKRLTIYIGGSVGDLLCLLQADIGIVMGSSASLMKLGHQFGITFIPLFAGLVKKQRNLVGDGPLNWNRLSGTLYTVSSWAEIRAYILGSYNTHTYTQ